MSREAHAGGYRLPPDRPRPRGSIAQGDAYIDHYLKPFLNVTACTLRYSGGLTYLPGERPFPTSTLLGYFLPTGAHRRMAMVRDASIPNEMLTGVFWGNETNREAVAPFDPKKRYKQVLMQCRDAESDDSERLRFLLLAGDTLVVGLLKNEAIAFGRPYRAPPLAVDFCGRSDVSVPD